MKTVTGDPDLDASIEQQREINRRARLNGYTNGGAKTNGDTETPQPPLWSISTLTKWAGVEIPPQPWLMEDWIIRGQCTGFYGIGGVRKTDFLLQLMIATALGSAFCGIPIERNPVLGLFCEDTDAEIARRAQRICTFYGRSLNDLWWCHYASLVGVALTELVSFDYGRAIPTAAFELIKSQMQTFQPKLLVLDTAPDFFGGSENDRRMVAQFIRMLDSLGQEFDCAIIFAAQPSVRGRFDRTLESGSTGWENKVRARLTIHDPAMDPANAGEDEDGRKTRPQPSDQRILTRVKCNYASQGEEMTLVFRNGGFLPEDINPDTAPLKGPARDIAARSKFLELLDAVSGPDRWVHMTPTSKDRYAPAVFVSHPDNKDKFTEKEFAKAMRWLRDKKQIRMDTIKFAGKTYPCIVRNVMGDEP